ncbi:MAG: MFS transporter [Candidatus Bathyarchaeota archaeon]|nr:MAG: MFS transporter [Candidatus Bathyarchaeota archaeon]
MGYLNRVGKETPQNRLFLPSLIIANFATGTLGILAALFLLDMSVTFGVDRGIMGQINTVSSIGSIIFALVMGILSIRLRHRTLILTGMFSYSISAIGCYFAWDINSILVFYSLNGVALAMVVPMTNSLIGDNVALERRVSAVGWTVAAGSLAYFIGAPLMGVLSGFGGWRLVLLSFVIPLALLALLMAVTFIPSVKQKVETGAASDIYVESFKKIALNRSSIGCLIGTIFRLAAFAALLFYGTAFTIERFDLSIDFASLVILVVALSYTIGSLTCSPVIKKVGRKSTTVIAVLFAGLFTISYAYAPSVWLSLTLMSIAGWFDGLAASASTSLTLEQMPELRGTMMSLSYAFVGIGSAIGAAVGGLTLILYDYRELGIILGSMGIIAAIIFQFATTDPTERNHAILQDQN